MIRQGLARAALLSYPPAMRAARGAEILGTVLEAADDRPDVLVREMLSLITGGVAERARSSARTSGAQMVADGCKLASVLYTVLWLTAFVQHPNLRWWHPNQLAALTAVGLLVSVLAWLLGQGRVAGVLGVAFSTVLLGDWRPSAIAISLLIVPMSGFVIMAIAPPRERPSLVWVAALGALVVVSTMMTRQGPGSPSAMFVLFGVTVAGVLTFAVQPRLAIAASLIWTTIGMQLIAHQESLRSPFPLLVVAAPMVFAATAARVGIIRRRTT